MTTHTPGPWRTNGCLIEGPRMGLQVAIAYAPKLGNAPRTAEEAKANGMLIAAAPDLLTALEAIGGMRVDASTDHAQLSALCIAIARAAIAKVKGVQS